MGEVEDGRWKMEGGRWKVEVRITRLMPGMSKELTMAVEGW